MTSPDNSPETLNSGVDVDEILDRFESEWQTGSPPDISSFLASAADSPEARRAQRDLLAELVAADLEYRWRLPPTGPHEVWKIEDYVNRFPALGPLEEIPLQLVTGEYRARCRFGDRPTHSEYVARFPDLKAEFATLLGKIDSEIKVETEQTVEGSDTVIGEREERATRLRVRCPHCQGLVETVREGSLADLTCATCGTSFSLVDCSNETRSAPVRRTFAQFDLVERIGFGAFGEVWKARDRELDRTVAVKIPRKDQLDVEEAEKFLREARAAAQLKHPSIVGIHEVGRHDDTLYIVSDLVRGVTLADWLTGEQPTQRRAVEICVKIAEALHHAHEAGVVHRDLKPDNIMLDAAGEPHIMDFGLAKRDAGEITMTMEGQVLGTPAYMSPEQAKGEGHQVDRRTDVYSLGVILFELLTGETPFRGNLRMMIHQVINEQAPSPRRMNNSISRDLETVCLKCLEKDPQKRYETAESMANDLRHYLACEPISARPIGQIERTWRWCQRRPLVTGLASLAFLLLALLSVVGMVGYVTTSKALRLAARREADIELARKDAVLSAKKAERARLDADLARRAAEETIVDLFTSSGLTAAKLDRHATAALWFANAAALSAKGSQHRRHNAIRAKAWQKKCILPTNAKVFPDVEIREIAFHPSERYLSVNAVDGQFLIWDLQGKGRSFQPMDAEISCGAWNTKGDRLALVTSEGLLVVLSFPSLETVFEITLSDSATFLEREEPDQPEPNDFAAIAFDPKDQFLAIANNRVHLISLSDEQVVSTSTGLGSIRHLDFGDHGQYLVVASLQRAICYQMSVVKSQTPELIPVTEILQNVGGRAVHRSLGTKPAITHRHDGVWTLPNLKEATFHAFSESDRNRHVPFNVGNLFCCCFSRSGRFAAMGSYPFAVVYDLQTGKRIGSDDNFRHANSVVHLSISPDERFLLTASIDHTARLWSLKDGTPVCPPLAHQDEVGRVLFGPSGRTWATLQDDGLLRVWQVGDGNRSYSIQYESQERLLGVSEDGRYAMPLTPRTHKLPKSTCVYDLRSGRAAGPVIPSSNYILSGVLSPTGEIAVTIETSSRQFPPFGGNMIRFWNSKTGEPLFTSLALDNGPFRGAISRDGKILALSCLNGAVILVELESGEIKGELFEPFDFYVKPQGIRHSTVQFSPSGKRLANVQGGKVAVWDTDASKLLFSYQHASRCRNVDFSPDERWLLSCSDDKTVMIHDVVTGALACRPLEHPNWVFQARFSSDGEQILTACRDNTARLWKWREGRLICPPMVHDNEVYSAAISSNGSWVVTTGVDNTARFWEASSGKLIAPIEPVAGKGVDARFVGEGEYAVVSAGNHIYGFDVSFLGDGKRDDLGEGALLLKAEIVSGQRIHAGGGEVNLTSADWIQRWQDFVESQRDQQTQPLDQQAVTSWHREQFQQSLQQNDVHAMSWHLNRSNSEFLEKFAGKPSLLALYDRSEKWKWSTPHGIDAINTDLFDGHPFLTNDGLTLTFAARRNDGNATDLWYVKRDRHDSDWDAPRRFPDVINSGGYELFPWLSEDQRTLLFCAGRPRGQGGYDLYISSRPTSHDSWSEPQNLGSTVNSESNEECPCMSSDGTELYFFSRRGGGYGENDIWVAHRDASDRQWGSPINLGPEINTQMHDKSQRLCCDDLVLLFQRSQHPTGISEETTWIATRESRDSQWSQPLPIPFLSEIHAECVNLNEHTGELIFNCRSKDDFKNLQIFGSVLVRRK